MSSGPVGGRRGVDKTSGYADVHGLHMYYEVQGEGSPLVLLHGGVQSIDLSFGELVPALVGRHRVIGVELQGHGRTADIDRVSTPAALAGDVVALLDHLGIERAHVLGFSMGAAVTFELAVSHPDRVRSVVPMSEPVRPDGMHEDLLDPAGHVTSTRMPTEQDYTAMQETYARLSPHPEHFADFMAGLSENWAVPKGWSDEQLAGITAPVLAVIGDHDFVTVEHGALMTELIPGAQLAVLPGTTHMTAPKRVDLLVPLLAAFLD
jgi:pimeloyl-ACP methyl ester carboxylesterase